MLNITGTEKITFGTELFDTNSDFASSKFTPTVAGKYLITVTVGWDSVVSGDTLFLKLYKNGALHLQQLFIAGSTAAAQSISLVVDANGSTDNFEIYASNNNRDTSTISGSALQTRFSGSRIA